MGSRVRVPSGPRKILHKSLWGIFHFYPSFFRLPGRGFLAEKSRCRFPATKWEFRIGPLSPTFYNTGCGNQNGIDPRSIEYDNRAEEALQRFLHEGMPDTTAWAQAETFSDSVRVVFRDVVDSCQTLLDSAVMYSPQSHLYYARKATLYLYCLDYGNALVWMKKALEKKGPPLASAQHRDAAAKDGKRIPSPDLVPSGSRPVPCARYLVASRRDELRSGPDLGRRKRTGPQSHRQPDKGHPAAGTTPADAGRSAGSSRCFSALTASFHLVIRFHCANCSIQAPHSPLM